RRRQLRLLVIAAALGVVLIGGGVGGACIEVGRANVQTVPTLPSPAPTVSGPIGSRLDLGARYASLAGAERCPCFLALVPTAHGQPDEVYFRSSPDVLTLVYHPRADLPATSDPEVGALVMMARASVDRSSFGKLIAPGARLQPVTVNGGGGFWISG